MMIFTLHDTESIGIVPVKKCYFCEPKAFFFFFFFLHDVHVHIQDILIFSCHFSLRSRITKLLS